MKKPKMNLVSFGLKRRRNKKKKLEINFASKNPSLCLIVYFMIPFFFLEQREINGW